MAEASSTIDDNAGFVKALHELFESARMQLDIYSVYFRRDEYGIEDNVDLLRQWLRSQPRARIRVMVHNGQVAMSRGHAFIEMGLRLTSFVEFRDPAQGSLPVGDMVLVDGRHLLRRPTPDAHIAEYWRDLPLRAQDSQRDFDALWTEGHASQHVRNLYL